MASPHIAGVTHESRRCIASVAAKQVLATIDSERPPWLVNPKVWLRFQEGYTVAFRAPAEG